VSVSVAIAVGALIASLAPLGAMWVTLKHSSNADYETSMERRIARLEKDLEACTARVRELQEENLQLMRRILK
jgi:hypothetical protein